MESRTVPVLFIDDHEEIYRVLRELLHEFGGGRYRMEWSGSYEEGLAAIRRQEHDLYLLDYMLGDRNGLELLREAVAGGCQAPIIFITGMGSPEIDLAAMKAGAADYLVKGQINGYNLERSIRYALERKQAQDALRRERAELERRVRERTTDLRQANRALRREVAERTRAEEAVREQADALRASEERYRRIVDTAHEGIWTVDREFRIDYANARLAEMLGYPLDELLGRSPLEFMCDVDLAAPDRMMRAHSPHGKGGVEFQLRRKDGGELWALTNASPILDEEGEFLGALCMLTDITERRRQAEALRASEERYRRIVDTAHEGIWTVDREFRIDYANARLAEMLDHPLDEILGRSPLEFAFPEDHAEYRQLAERQERGLAEQLSCRFRRRDGGELWCLASINPILDEGGALLGALAMLTDVTERKRQERFHSLLQSAPDPTVITNRRREIVFVNAQAIRLFGYTYEELQGERVETLVAPRCRGAYLDHHGDYLAERWSLPQGTALELDGRRRDGSEFPMEITLSRLHTQEDIYVTTAMRDTTERKRAEELRKRSVVLEEQNRQMEEASRLKNDFLAHMSHELRTPLNAIIGFSELMHDGKVGAPSEEHREYLGDILTSSRHLLRLINDILDLAKVEAGKMEFRPERANPAELATEVRDVVHALARSKQVEIRIAADPAVSEVVLDPSRFKQVLYNYLANAIKFSPVRSIVRVRILPEGGDEFRLEVEDSGAGVPAEGADRLFTEFQQLQPNEGQPGGTGLGLAVTRRLVEAQGGCVGVRPASRRGSVFYARLPRRTTAVQEAAGWNGRLLPEDR